MSYVHAAILPQAASVVAGVVILLFVAGIVPFSSLLFLLVALFLFASCIQYNVLARNEAPQTRPGAVANVRAWQNTERMQRAAVLSMLNTFGLGNPALQNIMAGQPAGASLHNLRLSMMNRDFTDAGKLAFEHFLHVMLCLLVTADLSHMTGLHPTEMPTQLSIDMCCQAEGVSLAMATLFIYTLQTVLVVAADYEMLLQLDQAENIAVPAACEEQMASLPAFKFEGAKVIADSTLCYPCCFTHCYAASLSVQHTTSKPQHASSTCTVICTVCQSPSRPKLIWQW